MDALAVACPVCKARAGVACRSLLFVLGRGAVHLGRMKMAKEMEEAIVAHFVYEMEQQLGKEY